MEKRAFFNKLHEEIGEELNISPDTVRALRNALLGQGWTKQDLITHLSTLIAKKTHSQKEIGRNIEISDYRLKYKKSVNRTKYNHTKFSLENLNKHIEQYQTTLDIVLRLDEPKLQSLLRKTEMDK